MFCLCSVTIYILCLSIASTGNGLLVECTILSGQAKFEHGSAVFFLVAAIFSASDGCSHHLISVFLLQREVVLHNYRSRRCLRTHQNLMKRRKPMPIQKGKLTSTSFVLVYCIIAHCNSIFLMNDVAFNANHRPLVNYWSFGDVS